MFCPSCGLEYTCCCSACVKRTGVKPYWSRRNDGPVSLERCLKCGFEQTMDWWENLEMEIYQNSKKVKKADAVGKK